MKNKTDNEIVCEAIEFFAVKHFDTIEMAGTVRYEKRNNINYFSLNLNEVEWDGDIEKLHHALSQYLTDWANKYHSHFSNDISIANITIEYLLPRKDDANQNISKHLALFYFPSYYYRGANQNTNKPLPFIIQKILDLWYSVISRNIIIVSIPTILLIILSVNKVSSDLEFQNRLADSFDYVNVASGIIASFVLGFLINKAINIRHDKLKHTKRIKKLSNELTYFRNICFNLLGDHNFWTDKNPSYESYKHGKSIINKISYGDYRFPNFDDDIEYAKWKSFYNDKVSNSVVGLVLQLDMMSGDSFLHSRLTYTKFPPNHIYTNNEMEKFIVFSESNEIWYCSSEAKIFPDTFRSSYAVGNILEDIKRIYPDKKDKELSSGLLEEVSLDFQYRIIPMLYNLTKLVESDLPLTMKYFTTTFILLLVFGLIIPSLTYVFFDTPYAFFSVYAVIGIVSHILLSLRAILNTENTLNTKSDYL